MLGSKSRCEKGQDHSLKGHLFTVPAAFPASSVLHPPSTASLYSLLESGLLFRDRITDTGWT